MSGVVICGVQWERCNQCAGWERYELLSYAPINPSLPTPAWVTCEADKSMKVDMCTKCMAGEPWTGPYRLEDQS